MNVISTPRPSCRKHVSVWNLARVGLSTVAVAIAGCSAPEPPPSGTDGVSISNADNGASTVYSGKFADDAQRDRPKSVNLLEKYSVDSPNGASQFNLTYATHLCVLTGITGDFEDAAPGGTSTPTGREIALKIANGGAYYFYTGDSAYPPAQGVAICADWNNFLTPAGYYRFISGEGSAFAGGNGSTTATAYMPGGDWATTLSGFQGRTDGFGEWGYVTQSTSTAVSSRLTTHEEDGSWWTTAGLLSYATSVFVGIPNSGRLVRLIGYQGGAYGLSDATAADTEFQVSTQSGYSSFWLAETNKALCYLTEASGRLRGFGEEIRIAMSGSRWLLYVTHGYGASAMARSRCMAYDQR